VRFRLAAVLRARQAQETTAKAAVLQARQEAAEAAERVRRMDEAIDARPGPGSVDGVESAAVVADQVSELTVAAQQRRMVEKLAERHADERRRSADAAEQRAADDVSTARSVIRSVES
jgi:flagellar FliJ protein